MYVFKHCLKEFQVDISKLETEHFGVEALM